MQESGAEEASGVEEVVYGERTAEHGYENDAGKVVLNRTSQTAFLICNEIGNQTRQSKKQRTGGWRIPAGANTAGIFFYNTEPSADPMPDGKYRNNLSSLESGCPWYDNNDDGRDSHNNKSDNDDDSVEVTKVDAPITMMQSDFQAVVDSSDAWMAKAKRQEVIIGLLKEKLEKYEPTGELVEQAQMSKWIKKYYTDDFVWK